MATPSIRQGNYGHATFNNAGVFRKSGGTNATRFYGMTFTNTGLMDVQSGFVDADSCRLNFNGVSTSPNFRLTGPYVVMLGANRLDGQMTWLDGTMSQGELTVTTNSTLTIAGETQKDLEAFILHNEGTVLLRGPAQIRGRRAQDDAFDNLPGALFEAQGNSNSILSSLIFRNAGQFRRSGTGTTSLISVTFTNTGLMQVQGGRFWFSHASPISLGSVSFVIGGSTPYSDFGPITVFNVANLSGALNVALRPGFVPAVGSRFAIVSSPTLNGTFALGQGFDLGGGKFLVPEYTPTNLTLVVISAGPRFQTVFRDTNGVTHLTLTATNGQAQVLEASTNLVHWLPLFTNTPAGPLLEFIDSEAAFLPLRFYRAMLPQR